MQANSKGLYGQIRTGRVSSTNAKKHTAQVQFFENDECVSFDLNVLVSFGGDYNLPAENALVLCLMIEGYDGFGYVVGQLYSESDAPPHDTKAARSLAGDDVRLGDPEADDKIALAPPTNDNFNALYSVLDTVFGNASSPLVTPAPGGPDPVYTAVKAALIAKQVAGDLPPADVSAEKVSAA